MTKYLTIAGLLTGAVILSFSVYFYFLAIFPVFILAGITSMSSRLRPFAWGLFIAALGGIGFFIIVMDVQSALPAGTEYDGNNGINRKSDCEIVSEMLDYNKKQVTAINQTQEANPADQDAQNQGLVKGLQGYVDQLSDPGIRGKAQQVVDTDKQTFLALAKMNEQPEAVPFPPPSGPVPGENELAELVRSSTKKQMENMKVLQTACPGVSVVSKTA